MTKPKILLFFLFATHLFACNGGVQNRSNGPTESKLNIYCFGMKIGEEKFSFKTVANGSSLYSKVLINKVFNVDVETEITFDQKFKPTSFKSSGHTFPWFEIPDEVLIKGQIIHRIKDGKVIGQSKEKIFFPIDTPVPNSLFEALIKYWKRSGAPPIIKSINSKDLRINFIGDTTLVLKKGINKLSRYMIQGVDWGMCIVWIDKDENLVASVTPLVAIKTYSVRAGYDDLKSVILSDYIKEGVEKLNSEIKPLNQFRPIVIRNVKVWTGVNDKLIDNVNILIKGDTLSEVTTASIQIPPDSYIVDGAGKTLLPGLWDMHAHLKQVEWLPAYLACGITSVRDLGNDFECINAMGAAAKSREAVSPNILKAGYIDAEGDPSYSGYQANTEDEAIAWVERYAQADFKWVKIWNNVKPQIAKVIIEEAHKRGMKVTGHIPNNMTYKEAVLLGMDEINHLSFIGNDLALTDTLSDDGEIVALLKDESVTIDPTLVVQEMQWRDSRRALSTFEPGAQKAPVSMRRAWGNFGRTPDIAAEGKKILKRNFVLLKNLSDAGVPIVAGSDQGFAGHSLLREIELYFEAGLSTLEAIKAATITPAKISGMLNKVGTVEPGKRADLILIDGNPFENISNLRKIDQVISGGKVYSIKVLQRLAEMDN